MILLFDYLSKIEELLQLFLTKGLISNYKITLRVINKASIYLLIENELHDNYIESELTRFKHDKIEFEFLRSSDIDSDSYYKELFSSEERIFLDSRKNLSNLLQANSNYKAEINSKVVTFYSYKGGVGRSTTLASCASYLSNHFGKKIFIIDCDLEAPGFTNYFLEDPSQINNHIGVVEYFMDLDFAPDSIDISNYVWEVGKDFSGNGAITIMPAGNLSDDLIDGDNILKTHKKHYLEGLARIDTSSSFTMGKKFSILLKNVDRFIQPDVILIDSRTGFNDIFGITAFNISDLVIGLFGNNVQSIPGLNFFIDRIIESKTGLNAILINAILSRRSSFIKFEEYVDTYIQNSAVNDDEDLIVIKTFPITRYNILETLGTNEEKKEDFIDLIGNKRFPEFNDIFSYVNEILKSAEVKEIFENEEEIIQIGNPGSDVRAITFTAEVEQETTKILGLELKAAYEHIQTIDRLSVGVQRLLKKKIISNLEQHWPSLYGENSTIEMKKNIFYRRSMEDIFNNNKFIILGNKGTGKTFLYEALKYPDIVERIQERAQKKGVFEFFHVIDKDSNKFFNTDLFDSNEDETFYHRFWIVYIWNVVMLDSEKRLGYKSNIKVYPILNNTVTKNRFIEIISSDELFIQIEEDLDSLDKFLKASKNDQKLIVIFDGLDHVVKPINWHYKIVPLINYWRYHSFSRISPKLFLRSDLFEKLSNITNVKELKNQAISIEWTQEELFGYFFKLILSVSKEEFLRYMSFTKVNSFEQIKQIKQRAGKDNQLPLEHYFLHPLVKSFFGQYASADNTPRFGESYDWFYRNLKNANNTISLRPFIDLINNAIEFAKTDDNSPYPILPAFYYVHGEARRTALGNHFTDIVSEQGNENLKVICNFIREKKSTQPIYLEVQKIEMINLLNEVITVNKLDSVTVDELIYLLKVNGIISENFRSNGLSYSFALLYKYYLGLKNRPKGNLRKYYD